MQSRAFSFPRDFAGRGTQRGICFLRTASRLAHSHSFAVQSPIDTVQIASRRKTIAFFVVLGCSLVALAIALTVGWTILNWRQGVLLFFGVIFFAAIIAGMILNTIFLVREIRRNEQHDGFINAVTHELKTPITSIRLYLETMQRRDVG